MIRTTSLGTGLASMLLVAPHAAGQEAPATGLQVAGVPAINFDSDEGFGYGAIVELYQYGEGGRVPYVWTLQPTIFLTTEGRRDVTIFFDAPHLLPRGSRLDAFLAREEHIATPYYGLGNGSVRDESLQTEANPYFYRFGRTRWQASVNVQHPIGPAGLRILMGAGAAHATVKPVPEEEGTTYLAEEMAGSPAPEGWTNDVRVGLVWDTRDRESGTRSGAFSELLVQRAAGVLGSDYAYARVTLTDRRYVPLHARVVLAQRLLLQHVTEGAPLHDLHRLQTSFKQQEGLGGARSVRGLPKNRYVGRGTFLWNLELRWRAAEFEIWGRQLHAVLTGFMDSGRVWGNGVEVAELFEDLHHGYGGGIRVGMGENFVIAADLGTSTEGDLPIYIGLGYLF